MRLVLIGLATVLSACGSTAAVEKSAPPMRDELSGETNATNDSTRPVDGTEPQTLGVEVEFLYPFETATDWVSFSDSVVTFRVVSERTIEPESSAPERMIGRSITVEVEAIVWSPATNRPRFRTGQQLTFNTLGWWEKNSDTTSRRQVVDASGVIPAVGSTYLSPMLFDHDEWSSPAATLYPVTDVVQRQPGGATAVGIEGLTVDEVRNLLASIPIDPVALTMLDLSPRERLLAVMASREGTETIPDEEAG